MSYEYPKLNISKLNLRFHHEIFFPANDPILGNYIIGCSGQESGNEARFFFAFSNHFPISIRLCSFLSPFYPHPAFFIFFKSIFFCPHCHTLYYYGLWLGMGSYILPSLKPTQNCRVRVWNKTLTSWCGVFLLMVKCGFREGELRCLKGKKFFQRNILIIQV